MVSQRDLRASDVDCGEIGVAELWARWRVPSKIASVLTGFRAIPFAQNHGENTASEVMYVLCG